MLCALLQLYRPRQLGDLADKLADGLGGLNPSDRNSVLTFVGGR